MKVHSIICLFLFCKNLFGLYSILTTLKIMMYSGITTIIVLLFGYENMFYLFIKEKRKIIIVDIAS